jgi:hypothetical protein
MHQEERTSSLALMLGMHATSYGQQRVWACMAPGRVATGCSGVCLAVQHSLCLWLHAGTVYDCQDPSQQMWHAGAMCCRRLLVSP